MLVSCVHPVAILSVVFCIICSLSMLVSDVLGDPYSSMLLPYDSAMHSKPT